MKFQVWKKGQPQTPYCTNTKPTWNSLRKAFNSKVILVVFPYSMIARMLYLFYFPLKWIGWLRHFKKEMKSASPSCYNILYHLLISQYGTLKSLIFWTRGSIMPSLLKIHPRRLKREGLDPDEDCTLFIPCRILAFWKDIKSNESFIANIYKGKLKWTY